MKISNFEKISKSENPIAKMVQKSVNRQTAIQKKHGETKADLVEAITGQSIASNPAINFANLRKFAVEVGKIVRDDKIARVTSVKNYADFGTDPDYKKVKNGLDYFLSFMTEFNYKLSFKSLTVAQIQKAQKTNTLDKLTQKVEVVKIEATQPKQITAKAKAEKTGPMVQPEPSTEALVEAERKGERSVASAKLPELMKKATLSKLVRELLKTHKPEAIIAAVQSASAPKNRAEKIQSAKKSAN